MLVPELVFEEPTQVILPLVLRQANQGSNVRFGLRHGVPAVILGRRHENDAVQSVEVRVVVLIVLRCKKACEDFRAVREFGFKQFTFALDWKMRANTQRFSMQLAQTRVSASRAFEMTYTRKYQIHEFVWPNLM